MRPISEVFEDIRRYLKERGQIHDNGFWERQAHFEHLERLINAELDIKTIISWLEYGTKKFKGTIPYISSQHYHDYLKELHEVITGSNLVIALFLKHLTSIHISTALKNSLVSNNQFVEELFNVIKSDTKKIEEIFVAAIVEKNIPAVNLLLKNRIEITRDIYNAAKRSDDEKIYQLIVQPFHNRKKHLVQKGSIATTTDFSESKPTIDHAVFTRVFNESSKDSRTVRAEITKASHYESLKDMIAIAALAAVSGHDAGKLRRKQMTIVLTDDIQKFRPTGPNDMGIYNSKNSVYVTGLPHLGLAVVPVLIHEVAHFVTQEVFKFHAKPYAKDDISHQTQFEDIGQNVKETLVSFTHSSKEEEIMALILNEVYEMYPPNHWAAELIVRVPQIISMLGEDKGIAVLANHFSELLEYYEKFFIPACKQYLEKHHADQYLDMPSSYASSNMLKT